MRGILVLTLVAAQATVDARQSPRAAAAYQRAVELEAKGDEAAALTLLWEAAGRAPRDAEIQNRLGEALERVGALDAAIEAYRAAVAANPSFRKASNHLILALVKAGRGPEAVARAQALADGAPDDPDHRFTLGLAQAEQDVAAAIVTFRRALELAPRHALARYNLALVLKRADRLPEAVDELQQLIASEPRAEAHYTLGVIYFHQGDIPRAVAGLRAAIAAQPSYADAHHTLGAVLHAQRDFQGAAAALRRAITLRPDMAAAHYSLARVLQALGDDKANAHLAEAERLRDLAEREQQARVWTAVGAEKFETGNLNGAADCFRRATAILDAYAPAHYQLGRTLQKLGEIAAARAAFARARQLNPSLVPPTDAR